MPNLEFRIYDGPDYKNEIWRWTINPDDLKPIASYVGQFAWQTLPMSLRPKYKYAFGLIYVDGKPLAVDKEMMKH